MRIWRMDCDAGTTGEILEKEQVQEEMEEVKEEEDQKEEVLEDLGTQA